MAPPDTIWHKESLKLKEIFGTREGFEICPNQLFQALIFSPSRTMPRVISSISGQSPGGLGMIECETCHGS